MGRDRYREGYAGDRPLLALKRHHPSLGTNDAGGGLAYPRGAIVEGVRSPPTAYRLTVERGRPRWVDESQRRAAAAGIKVSRIDLRGVHRVARRFDARVADQRC